MDTEVYETHDLDAAEHLISELFTPVRLHVSGGNGSMRLARTRLGEYVSLNRFTFGMGYTTQGPALGVIPIARIRAGTVTNRYDGRAHDSGPGDVMISLPPDRDWQGLAADLDVDSVYLDPVLLAQVADGPPRSGPVLRFTGNRPVSATAARWWSDTYDYVLAAVETLPAGPAPLVTGTLSRLLAATALTVFPNNARTGPSIGDRHDAHPATVRRAVAFIDDHTRTDISVADVAAACHVTIRAVQLAFRRHLDTTPMAYLRRARLAGAHHDLRTADPRTATVAAIAARWGFADHSRFTAGYRAAYGITPSHTLRHG
ncbi:AraC-like DNA-binding protein [Actinoplanes octamycinicus]|uniref:AraC-like DNA-binding protein n=1 Tax=Actinoplanes octamycinicus TaxID=135948 RepID=A0A7W7H0U3_9ACTN|nr:helix-turn-helix transcriptional regulator [Actinoplanes octamycinicus]MBB4741879.1 AraC-like DNA-binding protein [Actinoplanes octamycinicus]GIE60642.1 hypothetical protein Aoc01nite_60440 [Actinoplanes octamycinicus]